MMFFNQMNVNYIMEDEKFMDHVFYSCPLQVPNWKYYTFPSTFMGSQGLYDVYKYLYQNSERHKGLVSGNKIYLNEENNQLLMEELIFQERTKFRKANGIDESTTVFFISPGNEESEIKACLSKAAKAIELFITQYTKDNKMASDNFAVVVSLPEGILSEILKEKRSKE